MKRGGTLEDKVIFVTGAGGGIGRECAKVYSDEGALVAIGDIDLSAAEEACSTLSGDSIAIRCDVRERESVQAAIDKTMERFKRLDCVHNNAGISSPSKPLHATTEGEWDALFQTNVKSVLLTTSCAFEALRSAGGAIVNTASLVGLIGQSNHAAYVSTKGAMISLTKAMALDYASFGIRVNAVCPAAVWTPMLRQWAQEQENRDEMERYLNDIHALGYCPEGDVIGEAAAFLLSDRARFITGCILPVSGGAELGYRR